MSQLTHTKRSLERNRSRRPFKRLARRQIVALSMASLALLLAIAANLRPERDDYRIYRQRLVRSL